MDASTISPGTPATASEAREATRAQGRIMRGAIREHRNAIALALFVDVLFLVSAAVLLVHLRALDPGDACWTGYITQGLSADGCGGVMRAWSEAADPARFLTEAVGFTVPFLTGLLLVIPSTARAARRPLPGGGRELLVSLLPMLAIAMAGFVLVAVLASVLRDTILAWNAWGHGRLLELDDLGYQGVSYVARGFMALGIGALTGALLRRPTLAFAAAAVLVFAMNTTGAHVVHAELARVSATGIELPATDVPGQWSIAYVGPGYRDDQGRTVDLDAARARFRETCSTCPDDGFSQWLEDSYERVVLVALPDTWGLFLATDVVLSLAIGGACLALTFPVALRRRRRPAS